MKIDRWPTWAKVLLATVMMCVLGPLSINMQGYTPITLQSLGVILFPIIFGWKEGTTAIALYLGVGALGVPVFAEFKGGVEWFTSSSGGFLIGFVPTAAFAGIMAERTKQQFFRYFIIFLGSHLLLLLFGFAGLYLAEVHLENMADVGKYLLPGMFIKSFMGAILVFAVKIRGEED